MSNWLLILGLIVTTFLVKAFGPVLFGGRELPPAFTRVIACVAPALLTALVFASVFSDGQRLAVGAEAVGVGFAGLLLWRGHSLILAVAVAVAVTATLRAVLGH